MKIPLEFFSTFIKALSQETKMDIPLKSFRNHIRACQLIVTNTDSTGIKFPLETKTLKLALEICDLLFKRLKMDSVIIEPQFLCAKTLYAYINMLPVEFKTKYLDSIYQILCEYSRCKGDVENYWGQIVSFPNASDFFVSDVMIMSLINGFFNFDMERVDNKMLRDLCEKILQESLKIIVKSCMKYNNTTFVSFRNLSSVLNKMIEKNIVNSISDDTIKALSYVILYNWESPFAGIKDYNSDILKCYLELTEDSIEQFLEDVLNFSWNKAKYFCLCEILPFLRSKKIDLTILYDQLVRGVGYSLYNCYLVSAGAEFYKVMLDGMFELSQWYDLFFDTFSDVLMGENQMAKQNLLNHWLPATVKKYPSVITILINNFLEFSLTEHVEFSFLHVLKIARKSGILLEDWNDNSYNELVLKNSLKTALNHVDEDIRAQAIQIICCTYKVSTLPTEEEFELFKDFFITNVNYDSTSFRQNLLGCFTDFLVHLRDSYLHITKSGERSPKSESHISYVNIFEDFFVWLYEFICSNLKYSANYQRKYTSLQMLDITMRYLCHGYVDSEIYKSRRKSNQRYMGWKIMEHLKSKRKWLFENEKCVLLLTDTLTDPTNDIHNASVSILSQYYTENHHLKKLKNNLFITAMVMCNSKLFYEVESGCAIIRLLTKQYILGDQDIQVLIDPKNMFLDMLQYMIEKCQQQFVYHKDDVLLSICNGQPLYGILSAINAYIKEYRLSVNPVTVVCLVNLSHDIVVFYLDILLTKTKVADKQYPPSFAEMSLSVDHLIASSKYSMDVGTSTSSESVQTTNVQQLVLNHIWCNLKACCELSSTIINKCCDSLNEEYVNKCLEINTLILTRCRHKGAIESAGVCLGQCVRYITSSQNTTNISFILKILEKFLLNVTSSASLGRSITRRSAGLTILVHRIVTNDMQDGKPLFFKAMQILLNILSFYDNQEQEIYVMASTSQANVENLAITNEKDLPQATALHLMCRTVADGSLTHYIIQFASRLLSTCFRYFNSKEWQIRNGALQLYGALVPKLIGQKSRSGDLSSKSPMSADELFSHIPGAWQHIISNLRMTYSIENPKESFMCHSNLVPILSLLSNMATRYKLQQNGLPPSTLIKMANIDEIFVYLVNLLSSPIYNVRNLCARIIESFYSPVKFYQHWKHRKTSVVKENELHGYLLVLKYYVSYHLEMKKYMPTNHYNVIFIIFEDVAHSLEEFITNKTSYVCKVAHFEIMRDLRSNCIHYMDVLDATFTLADKDCDFNIRSGIYTWIGTCIRYFIDKCDNDSLMDVIPRCFKNRCVLENGLLPALRYRIEFNTPKFYAMKVIVKELIDTCDESNKHILKDIFDLMYVIMNHTPIDIVNVFEPSFIDMSLTLCEERADYNCGYLLPLICQILMKQYILSPHLEIVDLVLSLSGIVKNLSNVNMHESEVRLYSAIAAKHVAIILSHLCANTIGSDKKVLLIKNNILSLTFWLLQDEDSDIRYESAKILFFSETSVAHPTKRLKNIMTKEFLSKFFPQSDRYIGKFLRMLLREIKDNNTKMQADALENPFNHNTKNIYWELKIMKDIIWEVMPIAEPNEIRSPVKVLLTTPTP